MSEKTTGLARLREPFDPGAINLLPRNVRKNDNDKMKCDASNGRRVSMDGRYCGGYHALSIHLDYVGHAALTDRLLEVDPEWAWEPMATGPDGLPVFDNFGGLWIRLSICGVTRLGYGDAQGKNGSNAVKEAIGDALRNAGMRFGAALDLWHKGDLRDAGTEQGNDDHPDAGATALNQRREGAAHPNWQELYAAASGDVEKLQALRATGRRAGLPEDFGMFAAIETELKALQAGAPIEGKLVEA